MLGCWLISEWKVTLTYHIPYITDTIVNYTIARSNSFILYVIASIENTYIPKNF